GVRRKMSENRGPPLVQKLRCHDVRRRVGQQHLSTVDIGSDPMQRIRSEQELGQFRHQVLILCGLISLVRLRSTNTESRNIQDGRRIIAQEMIVTGKISPYVVEIRWSGPTVWSI